MTSCLFGFVSCIVVVFSGDGVIDVVILIGVFVIVVVLVIVIIVLVPNVSCYC